MLNNFIWGKCECSYLIVVFRYLIPGLICSGKSSVLFTHIVGKLAESVGVTPLIIIPGDNLNEFRAHLDSSVSVEDGRSRVAHEVRRDNGIFGVAKDVLEVGLGSFTHLVLDIIIGSILVKSDSEIDDRDVGGGNAEGHAGKLTVELRDDFTDSLGGTSGSGDNVGTSGTSSSPVLSSLGRSIDSELVHGDSMDSSHKSFSNSPVVVENLSYRGKAVSGARSVRDNVHAALVLLVVNSHDEHRGGITGGARNNSFLGSSIQVKSSSVGLGENTGRLANEVSSVLSPGDVTRVLLVSDSNEVSIDGDTTISLLNITFEAT